MKFKIVVEIGRKVGFVSYMNPGHNDTVMFKIWFILYPFCFAPRVVITNVHPARDG